MRNGSCLLSGYYLSVACYMCFANCLSGPQHISGIIMVIHCLFVFSSKGMGTLSAKAHVDFSQLLLFFIYFFPVGTPSA